MTNVDKDAFAISDDTYKWCVRTYETIKNRFGLNLCVHPDNALLGQGHIFLFNHFARFETVIPPYLIYRATGAHTRSVADHALFEGNERFSKFLRDVGAMPNNLPGLLAFLAAEILRGRKVVMFPEGGMVKDRRVVDHEGNFGVYSPSSKERRKHHRGAAVLALTLDIFKKRIRDLHKKNDVARIGRWVKALGLEDERQLLARANEPTLIVPATITFYPIRVHENVFSRAINLFTKDIPQQAAEEMLVESNLIFRDTDMDIRLNAPIPTDKKWRWWEQKLLDNYFRKIFSLDELFGLRDLAEGYAERMLARCINNETLRIRDQYMRALYTGTTINLSHLASTVITSLISRKQMEIGRVNFHRTLYLALKALQASPGVYLHRSLDWPDRYRGLLDGECIELDRFLSTCKDTGLVGRTPGAYRFLDKLCQDYTRNEVRIENPVIVYANEVAPIPAVGQAVDAALQKSASISNQELAFLLFDDELKAHTWNRNHFTAAQHREINAAETATKSGAPYLLLPKEPVRKGVLLVHGFLASPAELQDFGQDLHDQGFAVMGVRLAGHGTSPWDLKSRTWVEWLNSVRRGYRILSPFVDEIVVVGFSAGGALSLMLAAEHPEKLAGVASVSAPQTYRNRKLAFVPLVHGLNKLADWMPAFEGVMPFRDNDSEHPDINYHNIPIHGLYQLRVLTGELQDHLPQIDVPTLIVQGDNDPVVEPDSARQIFKKLTTIDKALHWVSSTRHGIVNEDTGGTCDLLSGFIARAEQAPKHWSRHNPPAQPPLRPIQAILDNSIARGPDRPCLDFMGQVSTYAEVGDAVRRAAKGLQNLGVRKGDRVGLCLPNCPYYVIGYFAAMTVGATVVNFNPLYTENEIRDQITDSGTTVMLTMDLKAIFPKVAAALNTTALRSIIVCSLGDALPLVKELLFNVLKRAEIAQIPKDLRIIPFDKLVSQGANPDPVTINPNSDIALLQYTGGTTGTPKGAMLTHANISANTEQVRLWMGDTDPDGERFLCVIPFFHVFAMTAAMNLGIATGAELILLPRFDLEDVLKTIDAKKPTVFPAVPTIFGAISVFKELGRYDLSSIRNCISGGAPLPSTVKASFEDLTGCVVVEGYGLSEASPVVACNPTDAENKPDSIGLPLPWTEVEIRDIDNSDVRVATGERGELAVRGPQVMAGYWNNPVATSETMRDGWLMTGDVGHIDEDGYLFLTDRLKDVIFCSGFKVYPRLIEDAIYLHPEVDEVIVIGIADEYRGETPKAFVKLKPGAQVSEGALLEFAAKNLNPIERPSEIEFRGELPKTMIGKLSKKELVSEHRQKQAELHHG
ncbi:MAG: alpha/beta fold hydrolase [Rhodospirillales bacterium]|nr:alpha/beta fold hydrolase [Rhodospirillales bacterium]